VESITMDREVMYLRDGMIPAYARLIYFGYWFSPEREMLQKSIDEAQKNTSGSISIRETSSSPAESPTRRSITAVSPPSTRTRSILSETPPVSSGSMP